MKIIKLNAIDSTNDYLKVFIKEKNGSNFTIVCTDFQTNGKGQMNNKWHSEKESNLLFSILVKDVNLPLQDFFKLHMQVSLAIFSVLQEEIPFVKIKWPNDILSRKQKIAGILIENSVKSGIISQSIIGIGLNVNQVIFPTSLPDATSLKIITGKEFNREELLHKMVTKLKINLKHLNEDTTELYCTNLYQLNIPSMYKDVKNNSFIGKIKGITEQGNLLVQLENETIKEFSFKEIKFL